MARPADATPQLTPGNTAGVTTLLPVIDRLRQRFSIGRVCVVADRGMISAATIEGLEARKLEYILGARERSDAVVRKIVLENEDPITPLLVERKAGETQLFVKQVKFEGKRYIVCRNEAEAEKDRKDREAIVAALDAQLKKGDRALIGNLGYRRYLRKIGKAKDQRSFEIDAGKLAEEARFDGIFVLRTTAKVKPLQAVLRYRDLLQAKISSCALYCGTDLRQPTALFGLPRIALRHLHWQPEVEQLALEPAFDRHAVRPASFRYVGARTPGEPGAVPRWCRRRGPTTSSP